MKARTLMMTALAALAATASRDVLVQVQPPAAPKPSYEPEPEPRRKENRALRRLRAHRAKQK